MTKHIKDFKGLEFGRWLCLGESKKIGRNRYEKCRCQHCGEERFVNRSSLLCGKSTYCGKQIKHGRSRDRIYAIWRGIYDRCNNKNRIKYQYYGGKGIKCVRDSFEDFYNDMGKSYEEHTKEYGEGDTTIDRIDNNGNYCKENCRRATRKEQANNMTRNICVEYKGVKYNSRKEMCEKLGLNYEMIRSRLNRGIDINTAIETKTINNLERDEVGRFKKVFNYNT